MNEFYSNFGLSLIYLISTLNFIYPFNLCNNSHLILFCILLPSNPLLLESDFHNSFKKTDKY